MKKSGIAQRACVATLVLVALFASTAAMAAPDRAAHQYFPLHVGDRWVYVRTDVHGIGGNPQNPYPMIEVRVSESYRRAGRLVFRVENYGFGLTSGAMEFFNHPGGQTVELNQDELGIWYPWGPPGTMVELPAFVSDCMHGSSGYQIGLSTITVPVGTWDECLTIAYNSQPCAERGLVSETFAPGMGLVERVITGRGGVETWALQYCYMNGHEFGAGVVLEQPTNETSEGIVLPVQPSTWGAIKAAFDDE